MGWDNPAVPWRELRRRMSWGAGAEPEDEPAPRPGGVRLSRSAGLRLSRPDGPPWAELHCHSSFSFLDGAATPGELVAEAARLGLVGLPPPVPDGMYGAPPCAPAAP